MLSFGFSSAGASSASAEQASSSTPPRSRSGTRQECEAPYGECPATRAAANATMTQIGRAIAMRFIREGGHSGRPTAISKLPSLLFLASSPGLLHHETAEQPKQHRSSPCSSTETDSLIVRVLCYDFALIFFQFAHYPPCEI